MTEDQLERSIEIKMNAADSALMNGRMSQAEYEAHMKVLNRWANGQYAKMRANKEWEI